MKDIIRWSSGNLLYFGLMVGFCLKCRSELAGKRQGAKFCETKCRVAYNQQLKRDGIIRNKAANKDETYLAEMLVTGVEYINMYIDIVDAKVSQPVIERVKCTVLEWAKSVETNSILKRISEEQNGEKTTK